MGGPQEDDQGMDGLGEGMDAERFQGLNDCSTAKLEAVFAMDPKYRALVAGDAIPRILPGTLKAAFTDEEIKAIREGSGEAIYEISDARRVMGTLIKPHTLALVTRRMFDTKDGKVHEATAGDILRIHSEKFAEDDVTRRIREYVMSSGNSEKNHQLSLALFSALWLEDNEREDMEHLNWVNKPLEIFRMMEGGSKLKDAQRVNLALGLQCAITSTVPIERLDDARARLHHRLEDSRPMCVITSTIGPNGKKIIIDTEPDGKLSLYEMDSRQRAEKWDESQRRLTVNVCLQRPLMEVE